MNRCDCGATIITADPDEVRCGACLIQDWTDFCEECGAEDDQPCVAGCPNESITVCK